MNAAGRGYVASGRDGLHYRERLGTERGAPSSPPDQPPMENHNSTRYCYPKDPAHRLRLAATVFLPALVILGASA